MSTRSLSETVGHRLRVALIAFGVVAGLLVGASLATATSPANASAPQTATPVADTPSTDDRAKLRNDLKAARALEGDARKAALKKIRAGAADGTYGDRIEKRTDRRADRRATRLALLPEALRADVKELRSAPKDDRKSMREDIRAKALAGGYGDAVRTAAQKLKDRWAL